MYTVVINIQITVHAFIGVQSSKRSSPVKAVDVMKQSKQGVN